VFTPSKEYWRRENKLLGLKHPVEAIGVAEFTPISHLLKLYFAKKEKG